MSTGNEVGNRYVKAIYQESGYASTLTCRPVPPAATPPRYEPTEPKWTSLMDFGCGKTTPDKTVCSFENQSITFTIVPCPPVQ